MVVRYRRQRAFLDGPADTGWDQTVQVRLAAPCTANGLGSLHDRVVDASSRSVKAGRFRLLGARLVSTRFGLINRDAGSLATQRGREIVERLTPTSTATSA